MKGETGLTFTRKLWKNSTTCRGSWALIEKKIGEGVGVGVGMRVGIGYKNRKY